MEKSKIFVQMTCLINSNKLEFSLRRPLRGAILKTCQNNFNKLKLGLQPDSFGETLAEGFLLLSKSFRLRLSKLFERRRGLQPAHSMEGPAAGLNPPTSDLPVGGGVITCPRGR